MTGKEKAWALIFFLLLPILLGEICMHRSDSYYCRYMRYYLCDPEPISKREVTAFTFSAPYGTAANSGTTTTTTTL